MSSTIDRVCSLLREMITAKTPAQLPDDLQSEIELSRLYADLLELRSFVMSIAGGDLSVSTHFNGYIAGALKSLQANLRHMTWQTQMIASGDFSQRLDFLGEFSNAFNAMTAQLESSLHTISEKEHELSRINAGLKQEIEHREKVQAALAESEAHYRNLTETMKDVVWVLNTETLRFIYASPSVQPLLGYTVEEIMQRTLDETLTPEQAKITRKKLRDNSARVLSGELPPDEYQTSEIEQACKDGSTKWTEVIMRYMLNEKTGIVEIRGVTRDISERRALRKELERQAATDSLTGLANRRHFLHVLQREMERCQRHEFPMSLLMLDIDHFKRVNDTYGHVMGDRALQAVAKVCAEQIRSFDLLGRIGGEEFALILVSTGLEEACNAAERLRERIEACEILTDDGLRIRVTVSIGVAGYRRGSETFSNLMARADEMLYLAKGKGRNRLECCE